jgi:hypothetical protein
MKKIIIEIPDGLEEKEALEWMRIKAERYNRSLKQNEVASLDSLIKPLMDEYDLKNNIRQVTEPIKIIEKA